MTSDGQEWRSSLSSVWAAEQEISHFIFWGDRLKKERGKMGVWGGAWHHFRQGNETGVRIDINYVIKIHKKRAQAAQSVHCLTICHVWPWNSRRLLCITVVKQRWQIIQQPPYCCCHSLLLLTELAVPSPRPSPPPLCCHGNTHTEQSGRPTPRARYRGCCSDCRCISQHPPAWLGQWWGNRRWEYWLCALGHCENHKHTDI